MAGRRHWLNLFGARACQHVIALLGETRERCPYVRPSACKDVHCAKTAQDKLVS